MQRLPAHRVCCAAGVMILALAAADAPAVVIAGAPDNFTAGDARFAGVGHLSSSGGASGVLISRWHVLTAAHAVGDPTGHTFTLDTPNGRASYALAEKVKHPLADLAICRLDSPAAFAGYELNTRADEIGQRVIVAGFGYGGSGAPDPAECPRGVGRWGENRVDTTLGKFLGFDFDAPSGKNDSGEGMITTGDSGGALFLSSGGALLLAGIHVSVSDRNANGILGDYGDVGYDLRVSSFAEWIEAQIQVPEPASLLLFGVGAAALLRRRRGRRIGGA